VPACASSADAIQTAFRLRVVNENSTLVWDSGAIRSNQSTNIIYSGPKLSQGTAYSWTVDVNRTYCGWSRSAPARFVTSLFDGWSERAMFISTPNSSATFGYFRKEIQARNDSVITFAIAHIAAIVDDPLLCGYKLYANGRLIDLGPGRGEAPVVGGDGRFRSIPYTTLDVADYMIDAVRTNGQNVVIAVEAMQAQAPNVLLQLRIGYANGAEDLILSDATWSAYNADVHRLPGPPHHGSSAGTGFLEYIDARYEPIRWKFPDFSLDSGWTDAKAFAMTDDQKKNIHQKMEPPLQTKDMVPASIRQRDDGLYLVDFGKEFQGGLRLSIEEGDTDGCTVHIKCGEALDASTQEVTTTWGWEFDWTMRAGTQVLEQHKYMECRFASFNFTTNVPSKFSVSAWTVHYPWNETDSYFTSSNATLNEVWNLARYTLDAASLDTYTDSNTRERRPYEADGIIAATGRLLVQRDFMWPRHSHAFVLHDPTWPVEWKQLSPFLGWQDYYATESVDLTVSFLDIMYNRTFIGCLASDGLLNTDDMGRHIVDWMPDGHETDETIQRGEFTASSRQSVSNMFAVRGLSLLATMCKVGGLLQNASSIASKASDLNDAVVRGMWNAKSGSYCDGVCADVKNNSLVMTNMFSLFFGLVADEYLKNAWQTVTDWGLEQMGDYGAFFYQLALSGSYYGGENTYGVPGNGTELLTALAKCDSSSWCSGLREDNLTTTRESWHDGTYSHQWGSSPVVGVAVGLMGVHQLEPGFRSFAVRPRLGDLTKASIRVPTLRGFIEIDATPDSISVRVPCNTAATLCLPLSSANELFSPSTHRLMLDNNEVQGTALKTSGHFCAARPVGCGSSGAPRILRGLKK